MGFCLCLFYSIIWVWFLVNIWFCVFCVSAFFVCLSVCPMYFLLRVSPSCFIVILYLMYNKTDTYICFLAASSFLQSDQDLSNYGNYVYASFPVDVVVYFHMQPSTFRFSCLPVSRVECMLQLPSLDIVFSSKRAEDELLNRYLCLCFQYFFLGFSYLLFIHT